MNQPHQIPIVNTESESSVEFDPSIFGGVEKLLEDREFVPGNTSDYKTSSIVSNMSLEEHKVRIVSLKKLHNAIKAELDLFSPDDLTENAVSLVAGHLESIKQLYVQFSVKSMIWRTIFLTSPLLLSNGRQSLSALAMTLVRTGKS